MKILSAKYEDGTDVPAEQVKVDLPRLEKAHKKAEKCETLWGVFGGVITIENREYQVCD